MDAMDEVERDAVMLGVAAPADLRSDCARFPPVWIDPPVPLLHSSSLTASVGSSTNPQVAYACGRSLSAKWPGTAQRLAVNRRPMHGG